MKFSKEEYTQYINSPRWKQKRAMALERAKGRCEQCGFSKWTRKLEVHHLTYKNFMNEKQEDLKVLCPECHKDADEERAKQGKLNSRRALESARLDGWATKVYGEEWSYSEDPERVADEFYDWLERRG